MKRKYIKPVTTVVMVEAQNNYCAATSNNSWIVGTKFYDTGKVDVENDDYDMGRVITDKDDAVHEYNPWNPDKW